MKHFVELTDMVLKRSLLDQRPLSLKLPTSLHAFPFAKTIISTNGFNLLSTSPFSLRAVTFS